MKIGPLAGLLFFLLVTPSYAQWHGHGGWHGDGWHGSGYGVGGGFLGGIVGGVVGGAISDIFRPAPVIVYQAPQYVPEIVPGSPAWYSYCAQKYRSWDGSTYLGYDGIRHPCV